MLAGTQKRGCPGRAGRVKEVKRLELGPIREEGNRRSPIGGRNPRERKTLKEVTARESQTNPKAPPPPRGVAMRTASVGMPGPSARRKNDVGRPRWCAPRKGEDTETRLGDVINTPDDQMSKKPIHGFVDGQMDECESHGGTNAERETGTKEEMQNRKRREGKRGQRALPTDDNRVTGSRDGMNKVEDATEEHTPIQQKEQRSYIQAKECR